MRLLIFLYCIARTLSHMFKTLLFLLLRPEINRSNELLLEIPHPDYPAFLSGETGLRFIQTHHNYICRV